MKLLDDLDLPDRLCLIAGVENNQEGTIISDRDRRQFLDDGSHSDKLKPSCLEDVSQAILEPFAYPNEDGGEACGGEWFAPVVIPRHFGKVAPPRITMARIFAAFWG